MSAKRNYDEAVADGEDDDSGDTNQNHRVRTAPPAMSDNTQELMALNEQIAQCSFRRSSLLTHMELKVSELHEAQRVINDVEVEIENLQQIQEFTLQLGPVITATGLYTSEESMDMEDDVLNPLAIEMGRLFSVQNGFVAYRDRVHNDLRNLQEEFNTVGAESEELHAKREELKQPAE